jgi:hypothetical protein
VDNGWDRWFMLVMPGDRPDALTLQPQFADNITWWKHLEVYASVMGVFLHITTLATANETRSSTVDITAADAPMTGVLKLDFWKVGPSASAASCSHWAFTCLRISAIRPCTSATGIAIASIFRDLAVVA